MYYIINIDSDGADTIFAKTRDKESAKHSVLECEAFAHNNNAIVPYKLFLGRDTIFFAVVLWADAVRLTKKYAEGRSGMLRSPKFQCLVHEGDVDLSTRRKARPPRK